LGVSLVLLATFVPSLSAADDPWIEVKSPNFTVVSNAGEGRARNVAWQFEQIRAAIQIGWPWARVLNRMGRRDEAIGHARASRALAQDRR
jgi:hypothetical protein